MPSFMNQLKSIKRGLTGMSNHFLKKKKKDPSSILVVNIMYKVLVTEVIKVLFHINICCKNYHE